MKIPLIELLENNPIIAAIKDDQGLEKAIQSPCEIIFVLYGNLINISWIVDKIHHANKYAIVHVDLIDGTSSKEIVVDFIKSTTKAHGIISSRAPLLKAAKEKGLYTIHRFFLIDSLSYHNLPKQYAASHADVIEIMPGCVIPKVLAWVQNLMHMPIIASGLVCEKEDAVAALKAGAVAVSTSSPEIWDAL